MSWLQRFGAFWYDFIIGDDWRIAAGVVATLAVVFGAAHHGVNDWWLLPPAVALLLGISVMHEFRRVTRAQATRAARAETDRAERDRDTSL